MMRIVSRAGKALSFLVGGESRSITLHPWPWRETGHPYFVVNPLHNADGHGGYTKAYDFDDDGIPCMRDDRKAPYHPLIVAGLAMKMMAVHAETGCEQAARRAETMCELLANSGRESAAWGRGSSAERMGSCQTYGNTQGVVISTLLRACRGKPSKPLADLLERAYRNLVQPVELGGCLSELDGGPFLEEFPRIPPSHQLGGCTSGLFGLYDLADALGHDEAATYASRIEETIARNIDRFITKNGWSVYALNVYGHRYLASMHYHRQHIARIRIIAERTGAESLARAFRTWQGSVATARRRIPAGLAKTAQVIWLRSVCRLPLHES